ncbi:MAG: dTMP kinase [Acidimicrobiia bacterium]
MTTVALIGADGAGKTTVGRCIENAGRVPAKYLYLGVNASASNHMLVTTRLLERRRRPDGAEHGPPPPPESVARGSSGARSTNGTLRGAVRAARVINTMADEWYRTLVAAWFRRQGKLVLTDRHYLADFAAYDMDTRLDLPLSRRLHGWMLRNLYPRPALMIFLDAPPEVLLQRKGEGTVADLRRRREDYLRVGELTANFVVVDAARPLDEVVEDVERHLQRLVGVRR